MSEAPNLDPEVILCVATENEASLWSRGGVTVDNEEDLHLDKSDVGNIILSHGTSIKEIHGYFLGLEQRKCCLLLAACKQTFCSVRLVRNDGRDSGIEEGAMMKPNHEHNESVVGLDAVEFQVFKNALKCAAYPVLGAPQPPSSGTPIPHTAGEKLRGAVEKSLPRLGLIHDGSQSLKLAGNKSSTFAGSQSIRHAGNKSPASQQDSGLEDQEDSGLVPTETLCELLRRAFRLTQEKFNHYEKIVTAHIKKTTPQKVLAEELVQQLKALENNQNPYYSPKAFLNRIGYDHWQKKERAHITDLLNKFWHFSLPALSDRDAKMPDLHRQYRQLLERLISYESPYRQQSELVAPAPTSNLSTASGRLLMEFSLRYGVGEQYRKIVYLNYLALNFDPTVWFLYHVTSSLTAVMETMPTKRSYLVIVQDEFDILKETLHLLHCKACTVIAKMKTLYSERGIRPSDGVVPLIELLSLTLQATSYLLMVPEQSLTTILTDVVQSIFPIAYERHKMVAQDELRHNKWDIELSPKLLNMLIGHIRDEVLDYKSNYQTVFQKYFNITEEASKAFYQLLMADVQKLLSLTSQTKKLNGDINRLMLSLGYRLNQLDQDWNMYISPSMQKWREYFQAESLQWGVVLKQKMYAFITYCVSKDTYRECDLEWSGSLHLSNIRRRKLRTISKSLTPSLNSAFTSPSSAQSTPPVFLSSISQPKHAARSRERYTSTPDHSEVPEFPVMTPEMDSMTPFQDRLSTRPSSDPLSISPGSVLKGSYLGDMARSFGHYDDENLLPFATLKHSSSMPELSSHSKCIEIRPTCHSDSRKHIRQSAKRDKRLKNDSYSRTSNNTNGSHMPSEGSETLTDDSGSRNGDFSFPPIEEIGTFVSSDRIKEIPVVVLSELENQRVFSSKRGYIATYTESSDSTERPTRLPVHDHSAFHQPNSLESDMMASVSHSSERAFQPIGYHNQSYEHYDSFTESLGSNVSFPRPAGLSTSSSATTLLISGSAVDIVVLLQRVVSFGEGLCKTLTPARNAFESDQSGLSGMHSDVKPWVMFARPRQGLYEQFLNVIRGMVCIYADNMLCMDLCGTTSSVAKRLAGSSLIEYLQTQQNSGLIWGCRHDSTGGQKCFEYLNKQTEFLCDRHEPISREMCMRINNVFFMTSCLELFHRRLGAVFSLSGDLSATSTRNIVQSSNSHYMLRSDFVMVDAYTYNPASDYDEVMETASQLYQPQGGPGTPPGVSTIHVTSAIDGERDHLMAVVRAMCRTMSYRLNLFVSDALSVLLLLKAPDVPVEAGLSPLTEFLSNYIHALRGWLYKDCFRRVLECLWIFIVQDFETELQTMERTDKDSMAFSQLLLQALACLLKFMNNQHASLQKELLLSQADDVSFKLSLYAMPIEQLAALYRSLSQDSTSSDSSSTDSMYETVLLVRQRLKCDLQRYKKGFSGSELIHWILSNIGLFENLDPALNAGEQMYKRERAQHIAQRLIDWEIIADIDGDSGGRDSPLSRSESPYPEMTIHIQAPGKGLWSGAASNTHTPRETPNPGGLKHNLQALSRQSGLKAYTPALKTGHGGYLKKGPNNREQDASQNGVQETLQNTSRQSLHSGMSVEPTLVSACISRENDVHPLQGRVGTDDEMLQQIGKVNSAESALLDSVESADFTASYSSVQRRISTCRMQGTPQSLISTISSESRNTIFFDSSSSFYFVKPYVDDQHPYSWKNLELLNLVEQCFQKKVSAQYVLRIIYSRRRTDPRVKKFMQKASSEMVEMIQFGSKTEDPATCVSS
ncbi:uncharacterized protein LOC127856367 [Dreissena polymorpha]|uniref:MHD2 domain-containing protein n=1 Tax=Dreissena polymorpha TaxID=45954 RepID=A0A9D4C4Q6_DREPO|nr:uncharacterized protein LOC127856367 [Dreissena polymorpha]KAH3717045.1 hypothetical protein DPMN_059825 [Dreissena polymorpha]